MMHSIRIRSALALLMLSGLAAAASASNDDAGQRARLRQQRQQTEADYQAALRACQDKFQVTDCELAAKAKRRTALASALKQEQQLDRIAQEERAQASRERLAVKQLTHDGKAELGAAALPNGAASPGNMQPAAPAAAKSKAVGQSIDSPATKQEQAARQAQQLKSARQQRIIKAREHEAQVRAREADLIARGKRAAALPMPDASAQAPASSSTR